jgi:glycosyltransferase involved in cell wall biosynthesis
LPWFSVGAAGRIEKLIGRVKPAIVHCNNFFALLYAGRAARRGGVPLVWTCHGPFDIDSAVKRRTARRWATHISCVSEAVRGEVTRRVREAARSSTDYLGIRPFEENTGAATLREIIRREWRVAGGAPLVAVVGRFQRIKGHRLLLEALPAVWRRLPELVVWLVGDPLADQPEEKREAAWIAREIRRLGWRERIHLMGYRPDARRMMRALDALVIPSRYESFSMTAVEGMEAGVPVIGPNAGGPAEIIDAPATGLLYRAGDAGDLAAQIVAALTREGQGAAFDAAAGPRRVAERFSAAAHWGRTWALYRRLNGPALEARQ